MKQQIYKALLMRYQAQMEEALVRIDALMKADVVPVHSNVIGEIDKQIQRVANAKEKMATIRQYYGNNGASSA